MTKRHAKPTTAQLVERTYRQMLQFKLTLLNQMALMRLDMATERHRDREHMKTLADHCARLLKEKETLQRQVEMSRKGRNTDWDWREKMAADIMNSSFEGSPGDGMPKVSSTRQVERRQALTPVEPVEYNSLSSFAKMEMSHKVIDIMQPPIPTLNFEMRQYPCGCSATGNGIQPLPDYCGTHGVLTDSVVTRRRVGACTLAHLHRPGIRCGVCGEVRG